MKTRKQKVICVLVSVFLLASFIVVPVSAEETATSSSTMLYMNNQPYLDAFTWTNGNGTYLPFEHLYYSDWPTLTEENDNFVSASLNEYDYPYVHYSVSLSPPQGTSKAPYFAMSYVLTDSYISSKFVDSTFRLTGGKLRFFTSNNIAVTDIRFSLRHFTPSTGAIGDIVAVTDFDSVVWNSSGSLFEYDCQINNVRFRYTSTATVLTYLVLCVDFKTTPLVFQAPFELGVDLGSEFNIIQYSNAGVVGSSEAPYYPELDVPMFSIPDDSYLDSMLQVQDGVLGNVSDLNGYVDSLNSSFSTGLMGFGDSIISVSLLLSYLVGDLPSFGNIVMISLSLGIIGFVFDIASTVITSVGNRAKSSSSGSGSNPKSDLKSKK